MSALDPLTICLVGCAATKRTVASAAKDLYRGNLFTAARRYAEECDEWRILSARHGLLDPETMIAPYDARLAPTDAPAWGRSVADAIVQAFADVGPYELRILAGEDYAHPVMLAMHATPTTWRANCVGVTAPLRGQGIGKRLAWLSARTETQP